MLKIIKIGGNIVDNPAKLRTFLADFAALPGDKILVHGGGKVATAISAALGIETVMIEGRRITDRETLNVVTMVYNGINKQIVSVLQALGCNAVGMCGADGRLIVSKKRVHETINYGFVGDPVAVNTTFARSLISAGYTLVVAPITLDEATLNGQATSDGMASSGSAPNGGASTRSMPRGTSAPNGLGDGLLNTNADTVAQTLAAAMAGMFAQTTVDNTPGNFDINSSFTACNASACNIGESGSGSCNTDENAGSIELVYCFEKQGVLLNVDDENSVIPRIDKSRFAELKASGAIHSGMLPKLENAFRALEKGVGKVVICAAENIAEPGYGGTVIVE